jgi:hypothetical protein
MPRRVEAKLHTPQRGTSWLSSLVITNALHPEERPAEQLYHLISYLCKADVLWGVGKKGEEEL